MASKVVIMLLLLATLLAAASAATDAKYVPKKVHPLLQISGDGRKLMGSSNAPTLLPSMPGGALAGARREAVVKNVAAPDGGRKLMSSGSIPAGIPLRGGGTIVRGTGSITAVPTSNAITQGRKLMNSAATGNSVNAQVIIQAASPSGSAFARISNLAGSPNNRKLMSGTNSYTKLGQNVQRDVGVRADKDKRLTTYRPPATGASQASKDTTRASTGGN